MVRSRRVFSAPPSQRPVMMGGKMVQNPDQEIEALKNQLVMLQMATGQASMMEAQLMASFGSNTSGYGQAQPAVGGPDPSRKTPWFPQGAPYPTTLTTEILAFTQLVSLDQQERDQRDALILSVAYAAIQVWPSSRLAVDGCYATGTSEPSAPLSLVISNCKKLTLADIEGLAIQGHAMQSSFDVEKKRGTFQIVSSNGIVLRATLYEGRDPGKARRTAIMKALNDIPHSRTLAILLRHILYHACATMVGTAPGALPHEALLCMAIFACRRTGDVDPANALVLFLNQFGKELDLKEVSLTVKGQTIPKVHPDDAISIVAPENSSINLAAGCTTWRMIRAHLQSFSSALKAFNPSTALTPLSTMIAHRPLWRRVNGQQAKLSQDNSLANTPEGGLAPQQSTPTPVQAAQAISGLRVAGNGVSPSNYSTSTQGMTPDSPLLALPDSTLMDFGRTQSLTIPRSPMLALEPVNSSIVDLAAQFPSHVQTGSKSLTELAQQFPEAVTPGSSVLVL